MPPCPELADLEDLVAGRPATAELRAHVGACGDCRRRSDEIAADQRLLSRIGDWMKADAPAAPAPTPAPLPEIDGYRVVAELHRGGQGIVFEGVQLSTRRKVALKVLLDGALASAAQIARFDREIETVLRLRHVNVVALLDRGRTRDGRHFFAMEFVEGVALDEHARRRRGERFAARDAVALFVKVCGAVHYAHQHGVVHRDLKPGNVLVDPGGEPRVLDFGLAKDVAADVAAAAATVTRPGWFVGTLAYASPEQLRGASDAIDARSDVYSLGVVLFELVTGALPVPVDGALPDVVRAILDVEPRVPRDVDQDLAAILGRALEKGRERRYVTAGELAADLERWLRGEPVDAQRGRLSYLLKKAIARHRLRFALAAAMLLVVVGAAVFSTVSWSQARSDAARARIDGRTRARVTEMVESMLLSLDPERARDRPVTMREVLDDAVRRLDAGPREEPAVESELRATLGGIYGVLGRLDESGAQLTRALELARALHPEGDEAVAKILLQHADVAFERADYAGTERRIAEATAELARLDGAAPATEDLALNALGRLRYGQGRLDEAEPLLARALALRRARGDDVAIATTLVLLSGVELERLEFAGAESHLREALRLRRGRGEAELASTAATLRALERLLLRQEEYDEARACLEEALTIDRKLFGDADAITFGDGVELAAVVDEAEGYAAAAERHATLAAKRSVLDGVESVAAAYTMGRLSRLARDGGDLATAEREERASLALYTKLVGPAHRSVVAVQARLAWVLYLRGRFDEAARMGRAALAALRAAAPLDAVVLGGATLDVAWIELELGRYEEAEARARESLALRAQAFGDDHGATAQSRNALAWILHVRGQDREAEELAKENLERQTLRFGERNAEVAQTLLNLAEIERARGELAPAEESFRRSIELRRELVGARSPELAMSLDDFGWFLIERQRIEEAGPPLQEALAIRRERLDAGHPLLGWSLNNVGVWRYWRRELDLAEALIGEAVETVRARVGPDHAGLGVWLGNLGAVKLAKRDFAGAQPLLLEGHRILVALRGASHPQTLSVAASLVTLFTSLGDPVRAAEFSAKPRAAREGGSH